MRSLWVPVILVCAGCAALGNDADDELKAGEVRQLAFTADGKNMVVTNDYDRYLGANTSAREKNHSRLRSFDVSDWAVTADTGELSLAYLRFAPSAGPMWVMQATNHDRFGRGNPFTLGPAYYLFDPLSMKPKRINVVEQDRDKPLCLPTTLSCSPKEAVCSFHLCPNPGTWAGTPAFVFDLKAEKKTIDLQDYPTQRLAPDDFAGPVLEYAPDGKHIASSYPCAPFQIQLYAASTGKLVKSMKVKSPVGAMRFTPMATGSLPFARRHRCGN